MFTISEECDIADRIATSRSVHVNAEIYLYKDIQLVPKAIGFGASTSISLGDNLHVTLVIAQPNKKKGSSLSGLFPSDVLLAYDIKIFEDDNKKGKRLKDLGLLRGRNSIIYDNTSLPTFFLRKNMPLNIMHGSCRKLHGSGEDCLFFADKLVNQNTLNLLHRPSVRVLRF